MINLNATCNAAAKVTGGTSVEDQFAQVLGPATTVSGYVGTVDFYTKGPDSDEELGQILNERTFYNYVTGRKSYRRSNEMRENIGANPAYAVP